jgi:drug/metabolite transporter (DMT)-like permease
MSPRGWALFALCSVIWGVPYLLIKVAVDAGVAPGFIAWARVALGAAILLPIALRRGSLRALRGRGGAVAAYTACEIAVPFVLIAVGERYITSSLAAILVATMPLLVALLSGSLSPADRPSPVRLAGLVTGFVGVAALLGVDIAGRSGELLGAALVLVATLGYAVAPIIVSRRLADLDPLGPVAASLALATIVLLPAALVAPPQAIPSFAALASLVVLGIVCTALGLVAFFALIAETGPGRASVVTYLNPLVAVIAGSLTLNERIGPATLIGLVLILVGSWLSTRSGGPATQAQAL